MKQTHVNAEELMEALRWFRTQPRDIQRAINKAIRSVDLCRVDGTRVLIASYRLHTRMMANSIPKGDKP